MAAGCQDAWQAEGTSLKNILTKEAQLSSQECPELYDSRYTSPSDIRDQGATVIPMGMKTGWGFKNTLFGRRE